MTATETADQLASALAVEGLTVDYRRGRVRTRAVDDVTLSIEPGETVGLVGESGSGKTSLSRAILGLVRPTSGSIVLGGQTLTHSRDRRALAAHLQVVFQDPYSSLDPAQSIGAIVAEALRHQQLGRREVKAQVADALNAVGLDSSAAGRYPRQFSGGQRQRIAVARAIVSRPRVVICDEPVSALDLSVQAQIVNLLMDLQATMGLSYLFIAHDLSVVRHLSQRVYVMYRGRIVESGLTEDIYERPGHPYTRALLAAAPVPDPVAQRERRSARAAQVRTRAAPGGGTTDGCAFAPRCPYVIATCETDRPELRARVADPGSVSCHRYPDLPTS